MKFEPDKFFIGVIDFFSIILPGGILAYFLYRAAGESKAFASLLPAFDGGAAAWVIFLLGAYLIGHFVFLIGSGLDLLYDPIRKRFWSGKRDAAHPKVKLLKHKHVGDEKGPELINTFQWAKAILVLQCPAGMVEVARFEADSKFFRSLVVVLLVMSIYAFMTASFLLGWIALALLTLSFWRYVERRFKSTQQAYWYVLALDGLDKLK